MKRQIPTLSLRQFNGSEDDRAAFVDEYRAALHGPGFFFLTDHGMDPRIVDAAMTVLPGFFERLPEDVRMRYRRDDYAGYTPSGAETALGAKRPDEKMTFHVRDGHAPEVCEVPAFTPSLKALFGEFEQLGHTLLRATGSESPPAEIPSRTPDGKLPAARGFLPRETRQQ